MSQWKLSWLLVVVALAVVLPQISAERFTGVVKGSKFEFLGKFCFDKGEESKDTVGTIAVDLKSNTDLSTLRVLLYSDEEDFWPAIYDEDSNSYKKLTCSEQQDHAKNWDDETHDVNNEKYKVTFVNKKWDETYPITQTARPRFWYVVLTDAGCAAMPSVEYNVHFLESGWDAWNEEFGVDQIGLNTLYLVFFFVYALFLAVHFYGVRGLSQKLNYVHPIVKVFSTVCICQFISVFSYLIHYGSFVNDGYGVPSLKKFGEVSDYMARIAFMLMLMLVAKGWTISSEELTGKKSILATIGLFTIMYMIILIWKYAVEDPASTTTPLTLAVFLYLLTACWFLFAGWFIFTIFQSWKGEENPVKKSLYLKLGVLYTPWFLALPFTIFLSLALDPWVQEKTTASCEVCFMTAGYFVFAWFLWPSRAEDYFQITTPDVSRTVDDYARL